MKQFDIYIVTLDPTVGAEIRKTRPAVIISPDVLNKNLKTVIIAPLTHAIKQYPSRIKITFQGQEGQIALDQIRTVDKRRLISRVGNTDPAVTLHIRTLMKAIFK